MAATMMSAELEARARRKMEADGQPESSISAFLHNLRQVISGHTGTIAEDSLEPTQDLPAWDGLPPAGNDAEAEAQTAVIKLNGGLGTSMGLDRAKSVLPVKNGASFLTLTRRQLAATGRRTGTPPVFVLLNSFSTRRDTQEELQKVHVPGAPEAWEMLQSRVPRLDAATLTPVTWPQNPELEWCPPGHGDIYPTLAAGMLERLRQRGIEILFVSNSDNLGATLDRKILNYFIQSGAPFMMEVARRTPSDRKGGHLARRRRDGRLILRESAQCAPGDADAFQDIERHTHFNTNNLWLRVDALEEMLRRTGGFLALPIIVNRKTVDPRDPLTPAVLQLETAMGAAIELFEGAVALEVPRTRFAPVKTTSDLMVVRSDAWRVDEDGQLVPDTDGVLPVVRLDDRFYKNMEDYEARLAGGTPSLRRCRSLMVQGDWTLESGVEFVGEVELIASRPQRLTAGSYSGRIER